MGKPRRNTNKRVHKKPEVEDEKVPWYFRLFSPEDVNEEIVNEVYGIDKVSCTRGDKGHKKKTNCSDNPNCFVHLGEYKRTPLEKILGIDPSDFVKNEQIRFSGLRNLGATCYMNSLLQCLYMNKSFRKMIYDWKSKEKIHLEASEDIPLQLQTLFGRLQLGPKRYVDPADFAKSIQIQPSVQQDPQEFFKLFMSLLDERYSKDIVKSHFVGQYKYSTMCGTCSNISERNCEFTELELPIKGNPTLAACLQEYLQEEHLKDSNQYFCENCQKLQDATRRMYLTELPEVLNFQLLRFVYDKKTEQKKKLKSRVAFPDKIDFAPYLHKSNSNGKEEANLETMEESKNGSQEKLIYQLTAVLTHKGASAYGGHYIAQIRDEVSNEWYKFDDEVVEKEEIVSDPEENKENNNGTKGKGKGKNAQPKKEVESEEGKVVNSCNAYMLIYRRIEEGKKEEEPEVPKEIAELIQMEGKTFDEEVGVYMTKKDKEEERQESMQKKFDEIMKQISPKNGEESFWIEKEFTSKWFKGEFSAFSDDCLPSINNAAHLCKHNKIAPDSLKDYKRISKVAWEHLQERFGGGPALSNEDFFCCDCIFEKRESLTSMNSFLDQKKKMIQSVTDFNKNNKGATDIYLISKHWWNSFKKVNVIDPTIIEDSPTQQIECEHEKINPSVETMMISKEVWEFLLKYFPESNEFPSTIAQGPELCAVCECENNQKQEEEDQKFELRKSEAKEFNSLKFDPSGVAMMFKGDPWVKLTLPQYLVDGDWVARWKKFNESTAVDRDTVGEVDNKKFICEHEKCQYDSLDLAELPKGTSKYPFIFVNQSVWKAIVEKYGGGPEVLITSVVKGKVEMQPEMCLECLEKQRDADRDSRIHFQSESLQIQIIASSQPGKRNTRSANPKPETLKNVNSSDKISKLKLMLMESITDLMPSQQRWSYNGVLLEEGNPLSYYKVIPGSTIVVNQVDGSAEFDDMGDFITVNDREEQGFKGTGLMGKAPEKRGEKESKVWNCKICTMENPQDFLVCSACDTQRVF
eukprot:TRINITY_DN971_c0_g1_i4.p1 TRINITY_DN971_c0_g1~~TRINITY_DN971_c0_g1_i4.p1  ORF type:complete len:1030 (-),score=320.61 TRINITY_DN971_c0_g1_i4:193-3282(-)